MKTDQLVIDSSVLLTVLVRNTEYYRLSYLLDSAERVFSTDFAITDSARVLKHLLTDSKLPASVVSPAFLRVLGIVDVYIPSLELIEEAFLESAKLWVEPSLLLEPLLARRMDIPYVSFHSDRRSVSEKLGVFVI